MLYEPNAQHCFRIVRALLKVPRGLIRPVPIVLPVCIAETL